MVIDHPFFNRWEKKLYKKIKGSWSPWRNPVFTISIWSSW